MPPDTADATNTTAPAGVVLRPPEGDRCAELLDVARRLSRPELALVHDIARALLCDGHSAYAAFSRALLSILPAEGRR